MQTNSSTPPQRGETGVRKDWVSRYGCHGLGLEVRSQHPGAASALRDRLECFPPGNGFANNLTFEFRLVSTEADHLEPPSGPLRPVYGSESGLVLYSERDDALWIDCSPAARALSHPAAGHSIVSVLESASNLEWLLAHPLFTFPLIEALKRRGLYSLHAAGAALGNAAVLVAGTSGAGKSTLALALAEAGLAFLGDDMVFLQRNGPGLLALAFPEEIDVTERSAAFFPEIARGLRSRFGAAWPKRQLSSRYLPGGVAWESRPAVVVLPRVSGRRESVLTRLEPGQALLELVPNVLLTEAAACQGHLDALGALASTCPCYRLETGSDLASAARLVRALLEAEV